MPNVCFVDTNVLLYARDPNFAGKQARAREWLRALAERSLLVVSPQVMNEFAHNVLRKMHHIAPHELLASLEDMRSWCTAEMSDETAIQGVLLHRRYGFAFFDATLLASAIMHDCDIFLSEDLAHGQRIDRLQIINPFAVAPLEFLAN
jgi:predicted nucleic acid-binding protein